MGGLYKPQIKFLYEINNDSDKTKSTEIEQNFNEIK